MRFSEIENHSLNRIILLLLRRIAHGPPAVADAQYSEFLAAWQAERIFIFLLRRAHPVSRVRAGAALS